MTQRSRNVHQEDSELADPTESTPSSPAPGDTPSPSAQADGTEQPADDESSSRALDEQRDKYLRLAAEYDNFRRRSLKERQEANWRGQLELVKNLIDALDDLARFAHVDPSTVDAKTVVDGAEMVERKLMKSLTSLGLEVVNPAGQPFDPALHEAVTTAPAATPEEDHIVSLVFQPGYVFNGQLLRPARVVVKQWNG